jgi:hypothetical protein
MSSRPSGRPAAASSKTSLVALPQGARSRQRPSPTRDGETTVEEAVWAQLQSRPAVERPGLMRAYLQQLAPREVTLLLELFEAGAPARGAEAPRANERPAPEVTAPSGDGLRLHAADPPASLSAARFSPSSQSVPQGQSRVRFWVGHGLVGR